MGRRAEGSPVMRQGGGAARASGERARGRGRDDLPQASACSPVQIAHCFASSNHLKE